MTDRKTFYRLAFLGTLAGYVWLTFNVFIEASNPVCLVKNIAGIPCPSCGSTRAILLIAEGRFLESINLNPLGSLLAFAMLVIPIWVAADFVRRTSTFHDVYVLADRQLRTNPFIASFCVFLIEMNWFWSISKGL